MDESPIRGSGVAVSSCLMFEDLDLFRTFYWLISIVGDLCFQPHVSSALSLHTKHWSYEYEAHVLGLEITSIAMGHLG